jgi:hypothetical protein
VSHQRDCNWHRNSQKPRPPRFPVTRVATKIIGVGAFTTLDDKITDGEDAGVSFFLEEGSIGHPRAEQACFLINEMNPDVSGEFVVRVSSCL